MFVKHVFSRDKRRHKKAGIGDRSVENRMRTKHGFQYGGILSKDVSGLKDRLLKSLI